MAERRSLAAGLEGLGVDPETARAFIVQEKPKPSHVHAVPAPAEISVEPVVETRLATPAPAHAFAADGVGEGTVGSAAKHLKPAAQKRPDPPQLLATLLVPVTVRLRPEVASALKRASLERQLNGVETYTQQDIVEEALLPWLRAEGLLE